MHQNNIIPGCPDRLWTTSGRREQPTMGRWGAWPQPQGTPRRSVRDPEWRHSWCQCPSRATWILTPRRWPARQTHWCHSWSGGQSWRHGNSCCWICWSWPWWSDLPMPFPPSRKSGLLHPPKPWMSGVFPTRAPDRSKSLPLPQGEWLHG